MPLWEYIEPVPRAASDADVFSAIAEPRRRRILELLEAGGARSVNELVAAMRLPQPTVSKHLAVLREVGVVGVTRDGKRRLYEIKAQELKAVNEWISRFERLWTHQLDRVKERAERLAAEARPSGARNNRHKEN